MEQTNSLAQVTQRILELTARLPKHSIPPAMIIELEELEEELERLTTHTNHGQA